MAELILESPKRPEKIELEVIPDIDVPSVEKRIISYLRSQGYAVKPLKVKVEKFLFNQNRPGYGGIGYIPATPENKTSFKLVYNRFFRFARGPPLAGYQISCEDFPAQFVINIYEDNFRPVAESLERIGREFPDIESLVKIDPIRESMENAYAEAKEILNQTLGVEMTEFMFGLPHSRPRVGYYKRPLDPDQNPPLLGLTKEEIKTMINRKAADIGIELKKGALYILTDVGLSVRSKPRTVQLLTEAAGLAVSENGGTIKKKHVKMAAKKLGLPTT